ncbi:MAG: hypothetical protein AB7W16_15675 [Candidatus Obscuribacterales bacterium]
MKSLDTLVEDIYDLVDEGLECTDEELSEFGKGVAEALANSLGRRENKKTLRMSNIGTPCNRKLWYTVKGVEAERLPPPARLKFAFGHILEELLLFLAKKSGHSVEGRQDTQEIEGIQGHRDAVIDGVVVDVKSASTYSFKKFEEGKLKEDDPFGYSDQIQSYLHAGQDDPLVTDKSRAAFLVIDKTLGNVCLDIHKKDRFPIDSLYRYKKEIVAKDDPPARKYEPIPDGKSGNMKLGMECSYCDFKKTCYPGLRTFLYSNKPVFLTEVKKEPNVPESRS